MRTKRSSDSKTYEYVYSGDKLVQMTITDHTTSPETVQLMEFSYDAAGQPLTMTLDGVIYYYVLNVQGDVMGMVDGDGNLLLSFIYEGFGAGYYTVGTSDMETTLVTTNPLGYRGYVMDVGTALYYLQSRYYDPALGRFINADSLISTGQGLLGYNMFAYCLNNPACAADPSGMTPQMGLSLLDYYIIHKIVQMLIVGQYGYAMEVYVTDSNGKRGFLDLYDYTTNQYYEVKHVAYSLSATDNQMSRYDGSTIKSWMFDEYILAGSPTRGTNFAISGSFTYGDHYVQYSVVAPGLIHYTTTPSGTRSPEFAYSTMPLEDKKAKDWIVTGGVLFMGGAGMKQQCLFGEDSLLNLGFS